MSIIRDQEGDIKTFNVVVLVTITVAMLIVAAMFIMPQYNVWQQGLAGQAELKRAEQNRQITIEEAKAQNEAATQQAEAKIKIEKANAEAEVERARGVAEANKIIGESLRGNESYLRYLWIQGLHDANGEVIYVPTEANLPLLEANRFGR